MELAGVLIGARLGRSFAAAAGAWQFLVLVIVGWAVLERKQALVARYDHVAEVVNVLLYPRQLDRGLLQAFMVFS